MYLSKSAFVEEITLRIYSAYIKAIEERGKFTLVLSGGNTPGDVFDHLILFYRDKINWQRVHLFWLDERFVPDDHKDSNYYLAEKRLISRVSNFGSIIKFEKNLSPELSVSHYQERIQNFFSGQEVVFDLILMGMGPDGHIASIFPHELGDIALKQDVFCTDQTHNGYLRLSMNYSYINNARCNLLMVNSKEKLNALTMQDSLPIHSVQNLVPVITLDEQKK